MDLFFMLLELISGSEGYSTRYAFDAVGAHAGS